MIKSVNGVEVEMTPDEEAEFLSALPPAQESSYTLFKTTLWLRLSDSEAETVMTAKALQPAKFRGIWDDALTIQSGSPFFDALKAFLAGTLSAKRAGELLQPEA